MRGGDAGTAVRGTSGVELLLRFADRCRQHSRAWLQTGAGGHGRAVPFNSLNEGLTVVDVVASTGSLF